MLQHDFILLDRSGSMASLWAEALGSVNTYVKKLADDKVDTGVTLAVFDANNGLEFNVIRDRITPPTWKEVDSSDAEPRGMTPLNDAIGKIVALANAGNYDKVAIIIMTDGQENSSRELTVDQAKKLLDECRAKNWQVIFLGANFDNVKQAANLGSTMAATMDFMPQGSLRSATASLASKRSAYGVTGQSINYTEEEKIALRSKTGSDKK